MLQLLFLFLTYLVRYQTILIFVSPKWAVTNIWIYIVKLNPIAQPIIEYALQVKNVCLSIYLAGGIFWIRNFWFVAYVGLFACRQSALKDLCHQKCSCTHQHTNCLLDGVISENKYWNKKRFALTIHFTVEVLYNLKIIWFFLFITV